MEGSTNGASARLASHHYHRQVALFYRKGDILKAYTFNIHAISSTRKHRWRQKQDLSDYLRRRLATHTAIITF